MDYEKPKRGSGFLRFVDRYWIFLYISPLLIGMAFYDTIMELYDPLWDYYRTDSPFFTQVLCGFTLIFPFLLAIYDIVRKSRRTHHFQLLLVLPLLCVSSFTVVNRVFTSVPTYVLQQETILHRDNIYHAHLALENDGWDSWLAVVIHTCNQNNRNCQEYGRQSMGFPDYSQFDYDQCPLHSRSCPAWNEIIHVEFAPDGDDIHLCILSEAGVRLVSHLDTEHNDEWLRISYQRPDTCDTTEQWNDPEQRPMCLCAERWAAAQ
ncbi:MAG: hypothetical protein AAF653_14940 [Chloroflexota bacterium]